MSLPERIPCRCGDLQGELVLKQAVVEFTDDSGKKKRVQPSEFEHLGGRSAAKKWKTSIKVHGIAGFDNKEIGQYLRDELGVDINRGVFTTSVPAKSGSHSKPPASSKAAVAKLAVAVKSGGGVSKPPSRAPVATPKRPLEDRLHSHLSNTYACYEVPTPSQITIDPESTNTRICLARAWPDFVCNSSAECAHSTMPTQASAAASNSPADGGDSSDRSGKETQTHDEISVDLVHGRPSHSSVGLLDLSKTSFPVLFNLSKNSGSDSALSSSILSGDPQVPQEKESRVPGNASTTET